MNNDFKNIKAVLFDFDDTLGHRESYAYDTFYRLLKSCTDFEDEMELEAILQRSEEHTSELQSQR